jgi:hypothetical protein
MVDLFSIPRSAPVAMSMEEPAVPTMKKCDAM